MSHDTDLELARQSPDMPGFPSSLFLITTCLPAFIYAILKPGYRRKYAVPLVYVHSACPWAAPAACFGYPTDQGIKL